MTSLTCVYVVF